MGDNGVDTSAESTESLTAEDGPVEATVEISVTAPGTKAAGVTCDALARSAEAAMARVFGDGRDDAGEEERSDSEGHPPHGGDAGGDAGGGSGGRIMDWGGGSGE